MTFEMSALSCLRMKKEKMGHTLRLVWTMLQFASKKRPGSESRNDYATHSDFCVIFREQLDRLFLLALFLTGDEISAEKCFLAAFDTCVCGNLVFKESAVSWSRRSVIKAAIGLMSPAPSDSSNPRFPDNDGNLDLEQEVHLKRVQKLPLFERFVFVMSVLERYSDYECALLLDCSRADILGARIHAFQQISKVEKRYASYSSGAQQYVVDTDWPECG